VTWYRPGQLGLIAFCLLAAGAAKTDVFNSPDGVFTVEFPSPPGLINLKGQTTLGTPYEENRWSAQTKYGYWTVAAFVYAKPRKTNYDANVAGAVAAAKGRLVSDQPIRQSGADGREIVIDCGKSGVVRERILWVGGTLYFVSYGGKDAAAAAAPMVDEFLISFEAAH
jgi:hypothetical protein